MLTPGKPPVRVRWQSPGLRLEGTPAELAASPDFVRSFLGGGGRAIPSSGT